MLQVLLVSNDLSGCDSTFRNLANAGAQVKRATVLFDVVSITQQSVIDAVIVDVRPEAIGLEAVRALRLAGVTAQIVLVSAGGAREAGLQAGADDVVAFDAEIARCLAAGARRRNTVPPVRLGSLEIDVSHRTVGIADCTVPLTEVEYAAFSALAARPGVVVGAASVEARLRQDADPGHCARQVVRQLARKLAVFKEDVSLAVRAGGFCLSPRGSAA